MADLRIPRETMDLLNDRAIRYNNPDFIELDPVSIPHRYTLKEDIEISGFLTAIISWGQRTTILNNSVKLMRMMDNSPHDFILNFTLQDLKPFTRFIHRTFNGDDCIYFLTALQNIYQKHGGLEKQFSGGQDPMAVKIHNFKKIFFESEHLPRTEKHIADPIKGASAKRINMFLRWMVRKDTRGVDFGIWEDIPPSRLFMPLDVHSGSVARKLGILQRKQNDWKSVEELTSTLKELDPRDPVKYDFALFGMGVFEDF